MFCVPTVLRPQCVFACAGQGCVYHLEECTVFGNVKSSPQWSGVVQTHTVLLDGPEIPLGAPRGESEEFKCFNMLSHPGGFETLRVFGKCMQHELICASVCLSFPPDFNEFSSHYLRYQASSYLE